MYPKFHFLLGLIASLVLFLIFQDPLSASIFFFGSFFIDFDHYIYYLFKKRNANLKKSIQWFKNKTNHKRIPYLFHGIEWIIIFTILGIYLHKYFIFLAGGMFFHIFLDIIHLLYNERKIHKISIIYDLIMFKN
jgi:hypothetical protein